MKFTSFILFTLISFTVCSYLVLPNTENGSNEECKSVTKSLTLKVHEFGKQINCDAKCGDFLKVLLSVVKVKIV